MLDAAIDDAVEWVKKWEYAFGGYNVRLQGSRRLSPEEVDAIRDTTSDLPRRWPERRKAVVTALVENGHHCAGHVLDRERYFAPRTAAMPTFEDLDGWFAEAIAEPPLPPLAANAASPTPSSTSAHVLTVPGLDCASDFGWVRRGDVLFDFTGSQRAVVELLWADLCAHGAGRTQEQLLQAAGGSSGRLRDIFKGNPAWNSLIVNAGRKDMYRLSPDQSPPEEEI